MKKFLKDIEPGDTFRVAGVETVYRALMVRTAEGRTRVVYDFPGHPTTRACDMTKPSLTHVTLS